VPVAASTFGIVSSAARAPGSPQLRGVSRAPATMSTGVSGSAPRRVSIPRASETTAPADGSGASKTSPAIRTSSGSTRMISWTAAWKTLATSRSRRFRPPPPPGYDS